MCVGRREFSWGKVRTFPRFKTKLSRCERARQLEKHTHQTRRTHLVSRRRTETPNGDQAVLCLGQLRGRTFLRSRMPLLVLGPRRVDRVTWQNPRVISSVHPQFPSLAKEVKKKERKKNKKKKKNNSWQIFSENVRLFRLVQRAR